MLRWPYHCSSESLFRFSALADLPVYFLEQKKGVLREYFSKTILSSPMELTGVAAMMEVLNQPTTQSERYSIGMIDWRESN